MRVVGDKLNRKHHRNNNDSRDSVTAVRIGSAAGTEGPRIYLASGKHVWREAVKDFGKHHKSPPGSHICMTPSAYMTDDTWKRMVRDVQGHPGNAEDL